MCYINFFNNKIFIIASGDVNWNIHYKYRYIRIKYSYFSSGSYNRPRLFPDVI